MSLHAYINLGVDDIDSLLYGGSGDGSNGPTTSSGAAPLSRQTTTVELDTVQRFQLDVLPQHAIVPHVAVFVNDPKLSDLKQLLISHGYHAEFSAGVLYINNCVSIRRNEAGRFHVEGAASPDYYRIRNIIYGQFAIV